MQIYLYDKTKIPRKYHPKIMITDMFDLSQIIGNQYKVNLNVVCVSDYGAVNSRLIFEKGMDCRRKKETLKQILYSIRWYCSATI